MSNNELVLNIMETINSIEEEGSTIIDHNYMLGYIGVTHNNGDE